MPFSKIPIKNILFIEEPYMISAYTKDMSLGESYPMAVAIPQDGDSIEELIHWANSRMVSLVPRGAGTSVTGAVLGSNESIIVDFSHLNKIKEINYSDQYAVVEPGVVCKQINNILKEKNFMFASQPGSASVCTIGGMVGCNSSGMRAIKYGSTRQHILGLKVITGTGEEINTGSITSTNSSGIDLTSLFVSSEGTLGLFKEITLKLTPIPGNVSLLILKTKDLSNSVDFIQKLKSDNIQLTAVELLDNFTISMLPSSISSMASNNEYILMIEFEGISTDYIISNLKQYSSSLFLIDLISDKNKIDYWWHLRNSVSAQLINIQPPKRLWPLSEDICVPLSKISDLLKMANSISKEFNLTLVTFGHLASGNLHFNLIVNINDKDEINKSKIFSEKLYDITHNIGGVISGEHGIGFTRRDYLEMYKKESNKFIRRLKELFDPGNILNPGKCNFNDEHIRISKITNNYSNFFGEEVDNIVKKCTFCGMCRDKCTAFSDKLIESYSPRGKISLIIEYLKGNINSPEPIREIFAFCIKCNAYCKESCPLGIDMRSLLNKLLKSNKFDLSSFI